jgi:hypothetical protein
MRYGYGLQGARRRIGKQKADNLGHELMKQMQTGQKKRRLVKNNDQNTVERRLTVGERRMGSQESVGK